MQKVTMQENIVESYRKFFNMRSKQMKSAQKNMKQTMIMTKVQKEWDLLNMEEKMRWMTNSNTPSKTKMRANESTKNVEDKMNNAPMPNMDSMQLVSRNLFSNSELNDSNRLDLTMPAKMPEMAQKRVSKRIQKMQKMEKNISKSDKYIMFFKRRYDMLKKEHPKWNSSKISQIISLLWKRMNKKPMPVEQPMKNEMRPMLPTGKMAFKQEKMMEGKSEHEANMMWKKLPIESKNKWNAQSKMNSRKMKMGMNNEIIMKMSGEMSDESDLTNLLKKH